MPYPKGKKEQFRMTYRQLKVKCKNQSASLVIHQEILWLVGKSQKPTFPTKASLLFQVSQDLFWKTWNSLTHGMKASGWMTWRF